MADVDDEERRTVGAPTDLKFVGPATAEAVEAAGFSAQDVADKEVSYRMLTEAGVNPGVAAKIRRHHSLAWSFDNDGDLDRRSEQVRGLKDEEAAWVASSHGDEADEVETIHADDIDGEGDSSSFPMDAEGDGEAEWVAESTSTDGVETLDDGDAGEEADAESAWVAHATVSAEDDASATADGSGDPLAAEAAWRERSKPTPLTEISGIGDDYADRLAEAGVTSIRSLATASPELLADVTGVSQQRLQRWHREASERAD
jgi:predicted flap endonuclease-1-like 5' DNA nuclease